MKKLSILLIFICLTTLLPASGFQLNEHGAKAMAMGGAFTGLANDASAIYYNPAGLTQLEGMNFYLGTTGIDPIFSFRGALPENTEYKMKDQFLISGNAYISQSLNDKLSLGFGFNNQYGLKSLWEDEWLGNKLAVETGIKTFYFTPSFGYKINEQFSIGGGFSYVYGDVIIRKMLSSAPFNLEYGEITLEGDDKNAYGYNLGILVKPLTNLSLGLTYRSEVKLNFEGDVEVDGPEELENNYPYGDISSDVTLPKNITLGLAYLFSEQLTFTFDYQYVGWSSYDEMEIKFEEDSSFNSVEKRNYNDCYIIRTGAEYKILPNFDLRGGLLYDKNPVTDKLLEPTLPDSDRIGYNIGFGYNLTEKMNIDFAYLLIRGKERKIENSEVEYNPGQYLNGVYNMTVHLISLNLGYSF